jgi:hypothetical protein
LFKLHSPLDYIAHEGVFVGYSFLPLAWQAFGEKNGVADYDTFESWLLEHSNLVGADSATGLRPMFVDRPATAVKRRYSSGV